MDYIRTRLNHIWDSHCQFEKFEENVDCFLNGCLNDPLKTQIAYSTNISLSLNQSLNEQGSINKEENIGQTIYWLELPYLQGRFTHYHGLDHLWHIRIHSSDFIYTQFPVKMDISNLWDITEDDDPDLECFSVFEEHGQGLHTRQCWTYTKVNHTLNVSMYTPVDVSISNPYPWMSFELEIVSHRSTLQDERVGHIIIQRDFQGRVSEGFSKWNDHCPPLLKTSSFHMAKSLTQEGSLLHILQSKSTVCTFIPPFKYPIKLSRSVLREEDGTVELVGTKTTSIEGSIFTYCTFHQNKKEEHDKEHNNIQHIELSSMYQWDLIRGVLYAQKTQLTVQGTRLYQRIQSSASTRKQIWKENGELWFDGEVEHDSFKCVLHHYDRYDVYNSFTHVSTLKLLPFLPPLLPCIDIALHAFISHDMALSETFATTPSICATIQQITLIPRYSVPCPCVPSPLTMPGSRSVTPLSFDKEEQEQEHDNNGRENKHEYEIKGEESEEEDHEEDHVEEVIPPRPLDPRNPFYPLSPITQTHMLNVISQFYHEAATLPEDSRPDFDVDVLSNQETKIRTYMEQFSVDKVFLQIQTFQLDPVIIEAQQQEIRRYLQILKTTSDSIEISQSVIHLMRLSQGCVVPSTFVPLVNGFMSHWIQYDSKDDSKDPSMDSSIPLHVAVLCHIPVPDIIEICKSVMPLVISQLGSIIENINSSSSELQNQYLEAGMKMVDTMKDHHGHFRIVDMTNKGNYHSLMDVTLDGSLLSWGQLLFQLFTPHMLKILYNSPLNCLLRMSGKALNEVNDYHIWPFMFSNVGSKINFITHFEQQFRHEIDPCNNSSRITEYHLSYDTSEPMDGGSSFFRQTFHCLFNSSKQSSVHQQTRFNKQILDASTNERQELLLALNSKRLIQRDITIAKKLLMQADGTPCMARLLIPRGTPVIMGARGNKFRSRLVRVKWIRPIQLVYGRTPNRVGDVPLDANQELEVLWNPVHQVIYAHDHVNVECAICQSERADQIATPCRHKACSGCWSQMRLESANCPFCRQHINHLYDLKELPQQPYSIDEAFSFVNSGYLERGFKYSRNHTIKIPGFDLNPSNRTGNGIYWTLNDWDAAQWSQFYTIPRWMYQHYNLPRSIPSLMDSELKVSIESKNEPEMKGQNVNDFNFKEILDICVPNHRLQHDESDISLKETDETAESNNSIELNISNQSSESTNELTTLIIQDQKHRGEYYEELGLPSLSHPFSIPILSTPHITETSNGNQMNSSNTNDMSELRGPQDEADLKSTECEMVYLGSSSII
ncbi:MAG: hypothetical protein Sylvanvirus17_7 [Sylvanvirus sp.]|uniref:RING-type domain-containing protein n=1 Tax=Sylvanvirus sp. TaxID=2487774 RepID=A0A3G5AIK8_9VIRU|nr:MAG: hypothetical protein Sylvanvirus17_7 [Sylvanvirus sp.]